jgi:hypothetical protein
LSKIMVLFFMLTVLVGACVPTPVGPTGLPLPVSPTATPFLPVTNTPIPSDTLAPTLTATPKPLVPDFAHIVLIVFENKEFGTVIGNSNMPNFNRLAQEYTLLTQHYAVTHPSLPNYLAMVGGDTFGITSDCTKCFISAPNLADQIEVSGRTWKTYQEDMPEACYLGGTLAYAQKHNPFIYFDSIRLNTSRCENAVVPLAQLETDIQAQSLPDFVFITPNICNDAHDCPVGIADNWLGKLMDQLVPALDADGKPYLIVLTWDEGQGDHSCCDLPSKAGGRVATVLVSPQVKVGFQDDTPYTHYSLLKTIETAWGLTYLGHAAEDSNVPIIAPWK